MPHGAWTRGPIAQLTISATCLGQRIINVHHFEATTAGELIFPTDTAKIAACQVLIDSWQSVAMTAWRACHNSPYVINLLRCQVLQTRAAVDHMLLPVEEAMTTGNAGTESSSFVEDLTTSIVLKWRSQTAGKSHRGRTYIGPMPDSWNQSGVVAGAGVTAAAAYGAAMLANWGVLAGSDLNWRLTVYSKPYDHFEYGYARGHGADRIWYFPEDYDGDSSNVAAYAVDPNLRTQRRRQLGVGV